MSKVKYIKYFNEKYINDILYKASKKLMSQRETFKYEVLLLLDNNTEKTIIETNSNINEVKFSDKSKQILNDTRNKNNYTIIHNHPTGGTFTYMDIVEFLRYPKLKLMIAIDNNCNNYFALYKSDVDDNELFNAAINIYNKFCATGKGHNEFSNLIEVLDRHGVKYEYFTF